MEYQVIQETLGNLPKWLDACDMWNFVLNATLQVMGATPRVIVDLLSDPAQAGSSTSTLLLLDDVDYVIIIIFIYIYIHIR